ncbi:MAG: DNA repair protein RecN [Bacteroidota bacterium]
MLSHLFIKNYALINELDINLHSDFTAITGETGAGKSIILGALGLLLGQRADVGALLDKEQKCVVEGTFAIANYKLQSFFKSNELDYADECIIRREINPAGSSRAFVNDSPVNLSVLKELGIRLMDIHSQHETLSINQENFQLNLLDVFADKESELQNYKEKFKKYKQLQNELQQLIEEENKAKKESDYFQFQFNELEEASLKPNEQEQLEEEQQTLANAENIQKNISGAINLLSEAELSTLSSLLESKNLINGVSKFNNELSEIGTRINSSYVELKDIVSELERVGESSISNPARLEEVDARLNLIYKLQQKHQVKTIAELIEIKNNLENQLLNFNSIADKIVRLSKASEELNKELWLTANKISEYRKKAALFIEAEVKKVLALLGMENAQLQINVEVDADLNNNGCNSIKFMFTANKGIEFKELSKVASGGELSRLLLSIKSLLATKKKLPTIIFDEIDTGVSGDIAAKMSSIMQTMAKTMQVFAITHLPQIASKGKQHLFVYKEIINEKTNSKLRYLSDAEREQELAKMLSSGELTEASLNNARELLKKVF